MGNLPEKLCLCLHVAPYSPCTEAGGHAVMQAKPLVLNSIHCNPCRPWQFTVAGGDAYVRVYDRRKAEAASCSGAEAEEDATANTRSFAAALATPVSPSSAPARPPASRPTHLHPRFPLASVLVLIMIVNCLSHHERCSLPKPAKLGSINTMVHCCHAIVNSGVIPLVEHIGVLERE